MAVADDQHDRPIPLIIKPERRVGEGRVAQALRAGGHRVLTPTLDGCAERRHQIRPGITTETHAAELAELLFFEDLRDVVMVGTSTGGMVMCRTAELARERVGRLVFADALALMNREALPDSARDCEVRPAELGDEIGSYAAVAIARYHATR